jgi:vancomycin resistance protein YoaR
MVHVRKSVVVVLGVGSVLGVAIGVGAHRLLPSHPLAAGVFIGEQRPPEDTPPAQWLIRRSDLRKKQVVHLRHDAEVIDTTLGELGVSIDVGATLERAETVGHDGSLIRCVREGMRARRGEIDVPLVYWVDREKARAYLTTIADRFYKAPVDAKLDIEHKKRIAPQEGQALDVEATIDAIAATDHREEETIDLVLHAVQAKVTTNDLANVDIEKVLSAFETTFATWGEGVGRAGNIKNAASKIDGTILLPGQVFSFNDKVGPRSAENGFVMAPEIQGDELVTGYGGGTCQVSSTLHAAALYGALEILDRQNHSRPSSYVQPGMDATVSFPVVDLKIKNNLSFPIMIHAYLPKPTAIRVELLGGDPVAKVTYAYGVGHVEDFVRRIKVIDYYPAGRVYRKQKGTRGMDVTSIVTTTYPDGRVEQRSYFSGYRPSPEVLWVAPGYKDTDLPPMPEHAKGVEGQTTARNDTGDLYPM